MYRHSLPLLVLCLLWSGCGLLGAKQSSNEPFQLSTDQSAYSPGDAITLTLANNSNYEIGYNLCFSTLERNSSSGWEELGTVGQEACPAVQYELAPGDEANYEQSLPGDLQEGEYRISTKVHWETEGDSGREESRSRELHTDSFTIHQ